jgi:CRP-like cAMP-binding protein
MHAQLGSPNARQTWTAARFERHRSAEAKVGRPGPYLRNRLFANARPELIEDLRRQLTPRACAKKDVVFEEGDPAMFVYMVDRGAIRIRHSSRDGELVTSAIIGESDFFGAEAAMGDLVRKSSATCIEPSNVWAILVQDVHDLMARDPVIALNVAMRFKEQRDDALEALEDIARLRVSDRLVHLFERLAKTHGTPLAGATLIDIRLTQADVASLIGSTRETVSTEMKNLVDSNVIRFAGRKVVLCGNAPSRRCPRCGLVERWPHRDLVASIRRLPIAACLPAAMDVTP